MANNLEYLVTTTRGSIIEQLKSANSLYDVVRELTDAAEKLSPEHEALIKLLNVEAIKIYNEAAKISDNAAAIGKSLSEVVTK